METHKMNLDEESKYKLDLSGTLIANFINFLFAVVIIGFTYILSKQIGTFENEVNKLLGDLVLMFSVVRLVIWCIHPQFRYKEIKEK